VLKKNKQISVELTLFQKQKWFWMI